MGKGKGRGRRWREREKEGEGEGGGWVMKCIILHQQCTEKPTCLRSAGSVHPIQPSLADEKVRSITTISAWHMPVIWQ